MWILLGLVAIAVRRPRGWPTLVALSLAAFAVVLLNAVGLFADLHFVLPGCAGFRAPRPRRPPRSAAPARYDARSTRRNDRVDDALARAPVDLADDPPRDTASLVGELRRMRERALDAATTSSNDSAR